jgi:hypothetical protein
VYGRRKVTPNLLEYSHERFWGPLLVRRSFYIEVDLSPKTGEVEAYVRSQ